MSNSDSNQYYAELDFSDALRVDKICLEFEQAWKRDVAPDIADYLPQGEPQNISYALFLELLKIECHYLSESGVEPSHHDYLVRFSEFREVIESEFECFETDQSLATIAWEDNDPAQQMGPFPRDFGPFRLIGKIGSAGQGTVYKAESIANPDLAPVALKCINAGVLASEDELQRFKLEANAVSKLVHPNIIRVYYFGENEGETYFTMPLVEGGTLRSKIKSLNNDFRRIAILVSKVAHAIQYAHEHAVLHRDLKPDNILLNMRGEPLVIDFGLAKHLDRNKGTVNEICGTINYMPPEQARGDTPTTAVDIYSLGAILYHCLTGRAPFQARDFSQFRDQIETDDPPRPVEINAQVPKALEAICLKCLQKDPETRYDSAEDLAQDLEHWLNDDPISILPENAWQRTRRWARKHPTIALLSALLLAVLLFGTGTVWYSSYQIRSLYEETLWLQYVSQIDLAQRELRDGNLAEAEWHLKLAPEKFRNWEHMYLQSVHRKRTPKVLEHASRVWTLAKNPQDADLIATGTADGTLSVWRLSTGEKISRKQNAHDGELWDVDWSADGKYLATVGSDAAVKLWNAKDLGILSSAKNILATCRMTQPVLSFANAKFPSCYSQFLSLANNHRFQLGDVKPWSVKFSPDSSALLTGWEDGSLICWKLKLQDDETKAVLSMDQVRHHKNGVWCIEFSPSKRWVAVASGGFENSRIIDDRGEVTFYDAQNLAQQQVVSDHRNACTSIAFSPNGKLFASSGYDKRSLVYEFDDETCDTNLRFSVRGHDDRRVTSVAFSSDNNYFATGSWDQNVILWNTRDGQPEKHFYGHEGPIAHISFSKEGEFELYSTGNFQETAGAVRIWNWNDDRNEFLEYRAHTGEIHALAFSPSSKACIVATAGEDGRISLWNDGKLDFLNLDMQNPAYCLAFHPSKPQMLVSGHRDGSVRIWNVDEKQLVFCSQEQNLPVLSVAFSPNGSLIAAGLGKRYDGSQKGRLMIWDAERKQLLHAIPTEQESIFSLAFHPRKNAVVTGSGIYDASVRDYVEGTVSIFDIDDQKISRLHLDQQNKIENLCFNSSGSLLASASSDKTIVLWDVNREQVFQILKGHKADVFCLTFSKDCKRLVSGSLDRSARIWDVARGVELLSFSLDEECKSVAFSPDNRRLAVAIADGTVRLYRIDDAETVIDN